MLELVLGRQVAIVMDKGTDVVQAIARLSYFYKHESHVDNVRHAVKALADVADDGTAGPW